jgi:BioD-like phosphotransacetylase family protein
MDRFVVTSLRQGAGKTSVIIGIAKALDRKIGYIKPFGERFLYRKKRLWDYDAALITNIFGLEDHPEEMSIGLDRKSVV